MSSHQLSIRVMALLFIATTALCSCNKSDSTPDPGTQTYFPRVKAIIQNNCMTCHSSTGSWVGRPTAFDTDTQIIAAHASIKAAVADPETVTNKRMPQVGTLSAADIDIIVQWHNKGGRST